MYKIYITGRRSNRRQSKFTHLALFLSFNRNKVGVYAAINLDEAIKAFAQHSPHLILTKKNLCYIEARFPACDK